MPDLLRSISMLLKVRLNKRANYLTSKRRCFHESRKRRGRRQNNPDRRLENDIHRIMNMVHMKKYGKIRMIATYIC